MWHQAGPGRKKGSLTKSERDKIGHLARERMEKNRERLKKTMHGYFVSGLSRASLETMAKRWKKRCPICPGNMPLGHCWTDVNAPEE